VLGSTHFVAGSLIGYAVGGVPGAFIGGFSALLPDIDCPDSTVGKLVKPLSWLVTTILGHRTVFHSFWIPLALYFLPAPYNLPIALGYLSHLLLDMLTPEGIIPLWPLPFRFSLPLVQTGSLAETFVFLGILIMGITYLAH